MDSMVRKRQGLKNLECPRCKTSIDLEGVECNVTNSIDSDTGKEKENVVVKGGSEIVTIFSSLLPPTELKKAVTTVREWEKKRAEENLQKIRDQQEQMGIQRNKAREKMDKKDIQGMNQLICQHYLGSWTI
jgi:hypothetical protein